MRLTMRQFILPLFVISTSSLATEEKINLPQLAEQHAAALYNKNYSPADYTVLRNINYAKRRGKHPGATLGELDILVLRNGEIVEVAEVKYTNSNAAKARRKGRDQLQRFVMNCVLRKCYFVNQSGEKLEIAVPALDKLKLGFVLYQGKDEWNLINEYMEYGVKP